MLAMALYICRDKNVTYSSLTKRKLKMKNLIATLIVAFAATSALAQAPAKTEEVKKPAAVVAAPATPKEMPKVEKPKTKAEKEAVKKDAKPADTKSAAPTATPAPTVKSDEKAPAKPAATPAK
jgi:hypothetical protein